MKKKISLKDLSVKSFKTSNQTLKIKGGTLFTETNLCTYCAGQQCAA